MHSLLWCREDDGSVEGLNCLSDKVRASINSLATAAEYKQMKEEGVVTSLDQLLSIMNRLKTILTHHHHRRCMIPVKSHKKYGELVSSSGNADINRAIGKWHCKVHLLSPNPNTHQFLALQVKHSSAALEVLIEIGLVVLIDARLESNDESRIKRHEHTDKSMRSNRHMPPTSAEDGVFSPVFAKLALINPNSDNVQYLDSHGVSQYLANYIAEIDECCRVYLKAPISTQVEARSFSSNVTEHLF